MLRIQRAPILALALALAASLGLPQSAIDPGAPTSSPVVAVATRTPVAAPSAAPATVIQPGSVNRSSFALRVTYDVNVTLHYGDRLLVVDSVMTITNTSGGPIDRLELNTIAARLGGLRVVAASVESRAVSVGISDQTLIVPLGGILPAGDTVQARLIYRAHLRADLAGSNWMFTRANGVIDAYRWLPWPSLRIPFTRPNHGDPFITPVSPSVKVRITTDRPLVFATTGDRTAGNRLSQTFAAQDVRDFTITASPDYRTASTVVGGTTIRAYYRPGGPGAAMLSAARNALAKMSALVGAYPYTTYKVVQSAGGFGMESPKLTWVPTGVASSNLRYLVTHETAHQWFYGLVGSNQPYEPYTDEAVADFLARYVLSLRRSSGCATTRLDLSIYRYSSACYYEVIYIQGGNFFDDLRRTMGATAFWNALRGYVASNRFGIVTTKTLLDTLDAATPQDLVPRYRSRFPRIY